MIRRIMRHNLPLLLLLAACAEGGGGKIAWVTDYDAGLKQAAAEKKPVMLYFGSAG